MPKPQVIKRWFIFCEPCSYRRIITADKPGADDLVEIKRTSVPGKVPVLDPKSKIKFTPSSAPGEPPRAASGKTKTSPDMERRKMFKCPQCGRGVTAKKLPDVYSNAYKEVDEEKRKRELEAEKKKRLADGLPPKRKTESDFMG